MGTRIAFRRVSRSQPWGYGLSELTNAAVLATMRRATSSLGSIGRCSTSGPVGSPWRANMVTRFVSVPKPLPASVTSFAQIRCAPLAWSFRVASAVSSPVSAANPTYTNASPKREVTDARMSGFGVNSIPREPPDRFIF